MVVDLRLWGKERGLGGACYPVVCHGLDTAAAARVLWRHTSWAPRHRRPLPCPLSRPPMSAWPRKPRARQAPLEAHPLSQVLPHNPT
ncbi:HD domain-containing protein [Saccharopolyspora thermophila]|uniref:HD domain-containing protein n=1 Tax=Saccharopolyspora thermophila TaxID=89367 RepID=UPI0035709BA9